MRYKGCKIYINLVRYDFEYIWYKDKNNILIFINENLTNKYKSKILHKILKKARQ